MKPRVLICSQDVDFYLVFSHILAVDGFTIELAGGVEEALALAGERELQTVVLDCQPASAAGPTICARLKEEPRTGLLLVVAPISPGAESDHLDLWRAGVDESFVRPIAPAKLVDYLRVKLTPGQPSINEVESGSSLGCGDVEMRLDTHRVHHKDHEIHLGPIEFNLLRHLLKNPGKVFSRDELIGAAWPQNIHVGERTVDVHISRLRKTLKTATLTIRTIRSVGYSLEKSDD
ncbi:response regulator transcription factor [Rhizobium sp. SEMIA 4085]|uniref:Response regulator CheY-like domain-containing protein n=1 Tax=Rhizobium gallicum bv. gallicum R602sp TaxID=1041138 RepID=A0A0B4XB51_9HYPH|nr:MULTISPECIES: response regulator transcription factor [Rhizobium]AJD43838.1 response regulator CheY-like domain-containing protein [Rhizobium gallicum bv. gallicum R602sp]NNH33771.1 response regulator transcription factor [Rhizobium sp. SEMIA 4085]TDW34320.1 two-component system phosphate regulon response regulator PhoB [Rhizobium azibense]